jgi:Zn-dependent protease|tara:strand:- start:83 stop:1003 length:921 start_codon:yes stop_codon:yes gene_type:complete
MASRDPRADIVENNPFPKPKIHRIHSNQDSNNSTIYTMDDLKSMFSNPKQTKPQTREVWQFSTIEKENLTLATAAFTLALGFMAVRGVGGVSTLGFNTWALTLLLSMPVLLLAVGPAFILHEIGHKIVAKKNGCWAEFRADPKGLQFGIILSFFLGFLFMAPGAVMVAGLVTRRQNGHIAVAGPLTNLSLFIIGIPLWVLILGLTGAFETSSIPLLENGSRAYLSDGSIIWQSMLIDAGVWWLSANLILGLFNMFPFGPLDGLKVKDWNEQVFYVVFLIFLIPVLGMFLGMWSPTALLENIVNKIF